MNEESIKKPTNRLDYLLEFEKLQIEFLKNSHISFR